MNKNGMDKWEDLNKEQMPKASKKFPFKILLIIIIIPLIAGISYVGYNKFLSTNNKKITASANNSKDNENKTEEKKESDDKKSENQPKNYIKDAEYSKEGLKESYYFYKEKMTPQDIVVPYLDLESESANKINKEIEKLYKEFIEMYISYSNEGLILELNETESYNYVKTNYTYNIVNDIISILIKVERTGRGSSIAEEYYTFNYDLKKDKILTLEDLCQKLNLNYDNAQKRVNEVLDTSIYNTYDLTDSLPDEKESIEECIKSNKEYFANQIKDKKVKAYINEKKQLNLIIYNEHPLGGCGFYWDFVAITE